MSLPLYDGGVASGLLNGLLFGYVLENAGFGSPRKLTAQFRFSDWSVFKVMFTAIIVAAIGLYGATEIGLLQANGVFIPTTFLWATLTGGALVGAGMAIGGYCPGTSTVGLATGRLDGLFFIVGMVIGVGLFAGVFLNKGGVPYEILMGRTFLEHFSLEYNGRAGRVALTWLPPR